MGRSDAAIATIAAMVTPALLILASASLISSSLVRTARVLDHVRVLATAVLDGTWPWLGMTLGELATTLERHERLSRYAERATLMLYAGVFVFVLTCLAIALESEMPDWLAESPVMLAIVGTTLMLSAGACMVVESRLSGSQMNEEIQRALLQMKSAPP